jgi:hypothetical protein
MQEGLGMQRVITSEDKEFLDFLIARAARNGWVNRKLIAGIRWRHVILLLSLPAYFFMHNLHQKDSPLVAKEKEILASVFEIERQLQSESSQEIRSLLLEKKQELVNSFFSFHDMRQKDDISHSLESEIFLNLLLVTIVLVYLYHSREQEMGKLASIIKDQISHSTDQ